jgi:Flp pilus assembly protein TadD
MSPKAALTAAMTVLISTALASCATPKPVEAMRVDGEHHFKFGRYEQAASEYRQIVHRYPGDWEAQHALGVCLLKLEDFTGARRALEVAHTHKPGHEAIAFALAEAMHRQGDQNALHAFLRERASSTQSVTVYLKHAQYAMEMGDFDSARTAVDTAIVLDKGKSVEPYSLAAELALKVGDVDLAVRRLAQAYHVNPYDRSVKQRLIDLGEVPGPTLAVEPGR